MNAVPPEPADLVQRLRQQMILAQVRIMELEDERDELAPRVAELEKLLGEAQQLADRKLDEAAHLERVRADLQAQYEHMRHLQHVTNEALEATRAELAATAEQLASTRSAGADLQRRLEDAAAHAATLSAEIGRSRAESAARAERIAQLDAELRAMKSSRSWRWTAWLRTLGRALRGS